MLRKKQQIKTVKWKDARNTFVMGQIYIPEQMFLKLRKHMMGGDLQIKIFKCKYKTFCEKSFDFSFQRKLKSSLSFLEYFVRFHDDCSRMNFVLWVMYPRRNLINEFRTLRSMSLEFSNIVILNNKIRLI